jgi:hypothetical protein
VDVQMVALAHGCHETGSWQRTLAADLAFVLA